MGPLRRPFVMMLAAPEGAAQAGIETVRRADSISASEAADRDALELKPTLRLRAFVLMPNV
jgi:hypothetical protein